MTGDDPHVVWAWAATVVLNAGLALIVGATASLSWSASHRSGWSAIACARSSTCLDVGVGLALVGSMADLWLRSANAADVPLADAWPAASGMLAGSHYGHAWSAGMIALLALAICSRLARHRTGTGTLVRWTAVLCIAVFAYTRSAVSHASASGDVSVGVAIDWLHLVLIALWIGIVFVAGLVGLDRPHATVPDRRDVAAWVGALSRTATWALVGIVATGGFNTWRATDGALGSLPASTYGTFLFVKLFFVLVSMALGAHNRLRGLPALLAALARPDGGTHEAKTFATVIRVEACTLTAALVMAAVLGSTEPPVAP